MPVVVSGQTETAFNYTGAVSASDYSIKWDAEAQATGFNGTPDIITTIAGNPALGGLSAGDGGPASTAGLYYPTGITRDAAGNLYIAEMYQHIIRKIAPSGIISTIAGTGIPGYSGDGGPATAAGLYNPGNLAVDPTGNIFIADTWNRVIRKINSYGIISTVAGNGTIGYSGDGGPATAAQLKGPRSVAVDGSGNIYIADEAVIRKVTAAGIITTVAGTGSYTLGSPFASDGGQATSAPLALPSDVCVLPEIYISPISTT
jgi:hypothetical protein